KPFRLTYKPHRKNMFLGGEITTNNSNKTVRFVDKSESYRNSVHSRQEKVVDEYTSEYTKTKGYNLYENLNGYREELGKLVSRSKKEKHVHFEDENAPASKPVNLEKIFTPADGEQIQPKPARKMFASSAFYEKGFHPTVEDQVELAKRISSSLSDISNQSSKGLQMYVNRKKRSVKWVHEGEVLFRNNNHYQEEKDELATSHKNFGYNLGSF
ncbi:hypothetical protein GWI33_011793, partial [Rhynchophorus ferrugineus]